MKKKSLKTLKSKIIGSFMFVATAALMMFAQAGVGSACIYALLEEPKIPQCLIRE